MAPTEEEVVANIRKYVEQTRNNIQDEMDVDNDASSKNLETRLDSTIEELRLRVKEQREALARVCYAWRKL
jgi:hypothetical protein